MACAQPSRRDGSLSLTCKLQECLLGLLLRRLGLRARLGGLPGRALASTSLSTSTDDGDKYPVSALHIQKVSGVVPETQQGDPHQV